MKTFKLFLLLAAIIVISYLSWAYYTNRLLQEKHDRATLVFEERLTPAKHLI